MVKALILHGKSIAFAVLKHRVSTSKAMLQPLRGLASHYFIHERKAVQNNTNVTPIP